MDERIKFVGRLLSGERMSDLCKEFGISRVTGYKIWNRYHEYGFKAIHDQSRAPHKHPNQTPFEVENLIVRLKRERPSWGAPKIREIIFNKYPSIKIPATSTVHSILDRHELVKKRRERSRFKAMASYLSAPRQPNDLWCVDFKGQFRMGNKNYCYPLTLSDFVSRFLISCEALSSTGENPCFSVFEQAFKEYGLPSAIRSDNGIPFASGNSLWNLTRLSVWWIRLGVKLERIEPGHPQQNGRHERMHRTLKLETTHPARLNLLQQQETFDKFKSRFNYERPHQALEMKCPATVYRKSSQPYQGLSDITYPDGDKTILISNCGRICFNKYKIHLSRAFANQPIGIKEVDTGIWRVEFMNYTLGYFDEESKKFSPNDDPFGLRMGKTV
ncbi:MAG: IS481 family transposase [Pseudomonadota bacterium]